MYETLLKDYLTYYQPQLKAELIQAKQLQAYLEQRTDAMSATRRHLLTQLEAAYPNMSQLQREMEADQLVREMFLPLP